MAEIASSEFGFLESIFTLKTIQTTEEKISLYLECIEPIPTDSDNEIDSIPRRGKRNTVKILSDFECKSGNSPKKEYIRCKLIRGHKRAIRNAFIGKKAKKTINRVNLKNKKQIVKLNEFSTHANNSKVMLEEVSRPENGPKTDGISKRSKVELDKAEKSFNNSYCRKYFRNSLTRESFKLYLDFLFHGSSVNELCDKFDFSCCSQRSNHNVDCKEKWTNLEKYLKVELLSELGIKSDSVSCLLPPDVSFGCEYNNMSFNL